MTRPSKFLDNGLKYVCEIASLTVHPPLFTYRKIPGILISVKG
jgi:hypothetical protein